MNLNKLAGVIFVSALLFLGLFVTVFRGLQIYLSGGWLATWIYIVSVIGFIAFCVWGFTHDL